MYSASDAENTLGPQQRICLLVTGMHCGGGAIMASVLHLLGADLPRTMPADGDLTNSSAAGSEQIAFAALNDEILASAGTGWQYADPVNPDWYASPRFAGFKARATALLDAEFQGSSFFVLNDPRIAKLLPFWQDVLNECNVRVAIVALYREPEDVVRDLQSACSLHPDIARLLWLRNHLEAERATRGMARSHVQLSSLLDEPEPVIAAIANAAGVTWPASSTRIHNEIGRLLASHSTGRPGRLPRSGDDWFGTAWSVFRAWAVSGETPDGQAQLDRIHSAFDDAMDHLGQPLDAMITLADELHRHQQSVADLQAQIDRSAAQPRPQGLSEEDAALHERHKAEIAALSTALQHAQDEHAAIAEAARADEARRIEDRWARVFSANQLARERLDEQNGAFQRSILHLTEELEGLRTRLAESDAQIARQQVLTIAEAVKIAPDHAQKVTKLRDTIRKRDETVLKLRKSLESRSAKMEELRSTLAARETALAQLRDSGERHAISIADGRDARLAHSRPAIIANALSPRTWFSPKIRRAAAQHRRARDIVGQSGMFDADWYSTHYPDVVAAGLDPLDHFIRSGGGERRHPSAHFNTKWYLDQYPDVREAGLNPLLHYLEHGREEGRLVRPVGKSAPDRTLLSAPAPAGVVVKTELVRPKAAAAPTEFEATWQARTTGWSELATPLAHRALRTHAELSGDTFPGAVAIGPQVIGLAGTGLSQPSLDRLRLFAALRRDIPEHARSIRVGEEHADSGHAHDCLSRAGLGIDLLADVWLAGESLMRIRMDRTAIAGAGAVRAYQFSSSGTVACCGEGALAGTSADTIDVKIDGQMLGLLLVFSDDDATVRHVALLPFPSLVRGGLHYSELACIEGPPGYVRSLADYSHSLALEFYGWPQGPARNSIGRIAVDLRGATGIEPIFRQDVAEALTVQYGIAAHPVGGRQDGAMSDLAQRLNGKVASEVTAVRAAQGATLELPADCLPSLYSLVSRRIGTRVVATSYCVADAATLKPATLVCLPVPSEPMARLDHPDLPAQFPLLVDQVGDEVPDGGVIAAPLAVRFLNPLSWQVDALLPVSPDQMLPLALVPAAADIAEANAAPLITAIIDLPAGAAAPDQLITSLSLQGLAGQLEVILACSEESEQLASVSAGDGTTPFAGLLRQSVSNGASQAGRLNEAASLAQGRYLLFLDPEVLLIDPRTLSALVAIAMQPGVGSAACAIVTERDGTDARVHSAGYFPTRMSLYSGPVFEVSRFDVARALPAATYPVVANQLKCCMVPVHVWASLNGLDATRFPATRFDLDLGYRAGQANLIHYCTTLVRAASANEEFNADFPDAIAHRSLRVANWQALLERVTVMRELRR